MNNKELELKIQKHKDVEQLDILKKKLKIMSDEIYDKKKKGENVDKLESIQQELEDKRETLLWELAEYYDAKIKFGGFK